MGGSAFVFLNGFYPRNDAKLIRGLIRRTRPRPLLVAVDGGLAMLQKLDIRPDHWISDLDSTPRIKKGYLKKIEVHLFPPDKEKTDAELGLELCAEYGIAEITIFGWNVRGAETDHLLGTLFLTRNLKKKKRDLKIRFLSSGQEIRALKDRSTIYHGYKGHRLSVIPTSTKIRLTLAGTKYKSDRLIVRAGETIALRNEITARQAKVGVEGTALSMTAPPYR
jgi:thiamine pyrophosphokinase